MAQTIEWSDTGDEVQYTDTQSLEGGQFRNPARGGLPWLRWCQLGSARRFDEAYQTAV